MSNLSKNIQFDNNNINSSIKRWIVLDIDGTLSMTVDQDEYLEMDVSTSHHFEKISYGGSRGGVEIAWVMIRPNLKYFLDYCFKNFKVGVWSMGQPKYVKSMVKHLFGSHDPVFVYDFRNCRRVHYPEIKITKPLNESPAKGGHIIEDDPRSIHRGDNNIIIPRFDTDHITDHSIDLELLTLIESLKLL